MAKFTSVKVNIKLPYIGGVEGTWEPDESERKAAWEMYVELITRISVAELRPEEGLLREALSSLHTLFDTTRKILRKYGPSIAQPKGKNILSFGYLAVTILNVVLRPVLAKWHPLLLDYENTKETFVSPVEHEQKWDKNEELRKVLNDVRDILIQYANLLAQVANVPSLIIQRTHYPKNSLNMVGATRISPTGKLLTGIIYDKKPFILRGQFRNIAYYGKGKR